LDIKIILNQFLNIISNINLLCVINLQLRKKFLDNYTLDSVDLSESMEELLIYTFLNEDLWTNIENSELMREAVETYSKARVHGVQGSQDQIWFKYFLIRKLIPNVSGLNEGK